VTFLGDELLRSTAALRDIDVRFALVGGLAVSVRAEPRFTRDADLAVAVADDSEAEHVTFAMGERGYRVLASIEHAFTGRLATVRLSATGDERSTVIDLLYASSGIEPEIVEAAEQLDVLPRIRLPVARVGHLVATKLLARDDDRRPLDRGDLIALANVATEPDWSDAAVAVALITERGYGRGRDLTSALSGLRISTDRV
jgi:hypothetical protein